MPTDLNMQELMAQSRKYNFHVRRHLRGRQRDVEIGPQRQHFSNTSPVLPEKLGREEK